MHNEKKGRNEIIAELAKKREIEEIVANIITVDDDEKDLIQDLYLDLLGKEEKLIISLYESGALKYFITRMVLNNIRSKNSPYYYKYKKRLQDCEDIDRYKDKISDDDRDY